ncbi:MAG: M48 family metallopeptidase [Candidatus Doudnabacteria bacterium]|nr:M48 family metallopeptidase [Candidatus Doudnabacteria bacterium]
MTFFLVLIIGLGYVFGLYFEQPGILPVVVVFSVAMSLFSYFFSDRVALGISHAKQINRSDDEDLYRTVENLSIAAGLPTPKIYLINDTAMNAFATGRDPKHATVAITSGLRSQLSKPELEGVMAHELSHIGNYDIRLSTIIVVLVGIIALISDWMLRISFYGGRRRSNNNSGGNGIILLIGVVLAFLSPLIATLIQLAISRKREYLADASGALLTRYPQGLAQALEKISHDHEPLEVANKATAHLYFSDPLDEHKRKKDGIGKFASLFQTHPPIADRITRLRQMNF